MEKTPPSPPPQKYIGTGQVTLVNPETKQLEDIRFYIRVMDLKYAIVEDGHIYLGHKTPTEDRRNAIRDALDEAYRQKYPPKPSTATQNTGLLAAPEDLVKKSAAE